MFKSVHVSLVSVVIKATGIIFLPQEADLFYRARIPIKRKRSGIAPCKNEGEGTEPRPHVGKNYFPHGFLLEPSNRNYSIVPKASNLSSDKTISLKAHIIAPLLLIWDCITQTRAPDFVTFNLAIPFSVYKEIALLEFI